MFISTCSVDMIHAWCYYEQHKQGREYYAQKDITGHFVLFRRGAAAPTVAARIIGHCRRQFVLLTERYNFQNKNSLLFSTLYFLNHAS